MKLGAGISPDIPMIYALPEIEVSRLVPVMKGWQRPIKHPVLRDSVRGRPTKSGYAPITMRLYLPAILLIGAATAMQRIQVRTAIRSAMPSACQ